MNSFRLLLKNIYFHILLFGVGFLLFSYPLISIADNKGMVHLFIYLFLIWICLIILLCMISISLAGSDTQTKSDGKSTRTTDV